MTKLKLNDRKINDSFQFLLENPKSIYSVLQKVVLTLKTDEANLSIQEMQKLEQLRELLLKIEEYNNEQTYKEILKALGIEKQEDEEKDLGGKLKFLREVILKENFSKG